MMKKPRQFTKFTPARAIVAYYLLAIIVAVILLSFPFVYQEGVSLSFLDVLFTAVSSVSVTGLTVINISESFSLPGTFILLLIFQLGGFGVMTIGTFFWLVLGKRIGLKSRQLIMVDQNQTTVQGVVVLVKEILKIIVIIQLLGAIILGLYLTNYYSSVSDAFYHGLFLAVSATTNVGFDITGDSMFSYADDYFIQIVTMILITAGAIGFPVLMEVKNYLFQRANRRRFRFSLFTKLTTATFGILLLVGTVFIYILEYSGSFKGLAWHKGLFYSLFQSVSTRSAGLATIDVSNFSEATQLVMSSLMFVGASPSSVGGGIRTTTFAVIVIFLFHYSKGHRNIKVFNREIFESDIFKAFTVLFMATLICFLAVIILSITESFSLNALVFEVASAFGTVGFSLGITASLSTFGKFVLMIIMFIGRIGIISFLFTLGGSDKEPPIKYPKEHVIIG